LRYTGAEDQLEPIKTDYISLKIGGDEGDGVLIVKEDLTALERIRLKRELNLQSLVSTLTMIIGSRDPFSRAHSERVGSVTKVLCNELDVSFAGAITAELAGAMMNLGKITVPREIFTKHEKLNAEELTIIMESILKSADMVEGIGFDGPVSETLRQTQALWQNYLNRIEKGVLLYNKTPSHGTYQVLSTQGITLEKAT
jgi:response regulator RpfG family c-di-GMP phosphodiesterase